MDHPAAQRRQGERRRLWDRRAPDNRRTADDRRRGERRSNASIEQSDRRAGERRSPSDRRAPLGRRRGRRRRETPTPYSVTEVAELRTRFAAPGPVACPACGSRFSFGPGRRRGAEMARRVVCLGCGRAAAVPHSRASRVLIVGANAALRDAIHRALAGEGHDVVEAPDAAVGLAAYQTIPADVVILDVITPGRLEAPEFLRRVRRQFPDARIVAVAGRPSYREADPLAVTHGLGAMRTVRMPLAREQLLRAVDEVRG